MPSRRNPTYPINICAMEKEIATCIEYELLEECFDTSKTQQMEP
ncbi:MAG: hypothetical protein ACUVXA_13780 [Candidatus Jordarchaeum sp.]